MDTDTETIKRTMKCNEVKFGKLCVTRGYLYENMPTNTNSVIFIPNVTMSTSISKGDLYIMFNLKVKVYKTLKVIVKSEPNLLNPNSKYRNVCMANLTSHLAWEFAEGDDMLLIDQRAILNNLENFKSTVVGATPAAIPQEEFEEMLRFYEEETAVEEYQQFIKLLNSTANTEENNKDLQELLVYSVPESKVPWLSTKNTCFPKAKLTYLKYLKITHSMCRSPSLLFSFLHNNRCNNFYSTGKSYFYSISYIRFLTYTVITKELPFGEKKSYQIFLRLTSS
jgi:hypothetical protein